MNLSRSVVVEDEIYFLETFAPTVFGASIFVINVCLLFCVSRLLLSGDSKRDKYGIVIHSLFVCLNDTFSGLEMFLVGLVRVDSYISAFVCAISMFLSLTTQLISQANMACICAQRYILSRNIFTTKMN